MKQIKQFRYYGATSEHNYPTTFSNYYGTLIKGNIFEGHGTISHLGIQGVPGTKFYLNNSHFPITIGFTGIFELDLGGFDGIYAIRFDKNSIEEYGKDDNHCRLLIDIIYEGGGQT